MSQDSLAKVLGVRQTAVSQWENGDRSPRDPGEIDAKLRACEDTLDLLIDQIYEAGRRESACLNSPYVELRTFWADREYWAADKAAAAEKWPAGLHRTATVHAARVLLEDFEIIARIVE